MPPAAGYEWACLSQQRSERIVSDNLQRQLEGLSILLNLERRVRRAEDLEELGFILVNETHNLIPYRQCLLWESDGGRGAVRAISGVSQVEKDAP